MAQNVESTIRIAGAGLSAQSARLRVVAENLANAHVTSTTAGGNPYRRKTISFQAVAPGDDTVSRIDAFEITHDPRPFRAEYEPGHPAADAAGTVKYANVDPTIELADMREANRSYLANLQILKQARETISATLDLLRNT